MFEGLRQVIGVFNYINHPRALAILRDNVDFLQSVVRWIEGQIPPMANAEQHFIEFIPAWYEYAATLARSWLADRLIDIRARFQREINAGNTPPSVQNVLDMVNALYDALDEIRSPF